MKQDHYEIFKNTLLESNKTFQAIYKNPIGNKVIDSPLGRCVFSFDRTQEDINKEISDFWNTPTNKNIIAFLRLKGFKHINYEDRTASKDGKNFQRIGRILNEMEPELSEKWKEATNKTVATKSKKIWVISANPSDVLRASYRRKWSSCMNDGSYIRQAYVDGRPSLIAYLCDEDDTEITNPYGRFFLHCGYQLPNTSRKMLSLDTENCQTTQIQIPTKTENKKFIDNGILIMDSLYGSASPSEQAALTRIINGANDSILEKHNLQVMRFDCYEGVYLNRGSFSQYTKTKEPKDQKSDKPVKFVFRETSDSTLLTKCHSYRGITKKTPSYSTIEYALNHLDQLPSFSPALTKFLFDSKYLTLDKVDEMEAINTNNIAQLKQAIVESNDPKRITKISNDLKICLERADKFSDLKKTVENKLAKAKA